MDLVLTLLPSFGVASVVGLLLALALGTGQAGRLRSRAAALAVGIAYLAGHALVFRPEFPPAESKGTLFAVVAISTLFAATGTAATATSAGYRSLRALLAAFAPLYILWNLVQRWDMGQVLRHLLPLQMAWWLIDGALEARVSRRSARASLGSFLIAFASAGAVFERSGSASYAQMAGIAAAAVGAVLASDFLRPLPSLQGGAVLAPWSVLAGMLVAGWHLFDIPKSSALLLALAPLAANFPDLDRVERTRPQLALVLRWLVALSLGAAAVALAAAAAPTPYGS